MVSFLGQPIAVNIVKALSKPPKEKGSQRGSRNQKGKRLHLERRRNLESKSEIRVNSDWTIVAETPHSPYPSVIINLNLKERNSARSKILPLRNFFVEYHQKNSLCLKKQEIHSSEGCSMSYESCSIVVTWAPGNQLASVLTLVRELSDYLDLPRAGGSGKTPLSGRLNKTSFKCFLIRFLTDDPQSAYLAVGLDRPFQRELMGQPWRPFWRAIPDALKVMFEDFSHGGL